MTATDDQLDRLAQVAARIVTDHARIESTVQQLRAAGVPWSRIAGALGVSKQAAAQRYGRRTLDVVAPQAAYQAGDHPRWSPDGGALPPSGE